MHTPAEKSVVLKDDIARMTSRNIVRMLQMLRHHISDFEPCVILIGRTEGFMLVSHFADRRYIEATKQVGRIKGDSPNPQEDVCIHCGECADYYDDEREYGFTRRSRVGRLWPMVGYVCNLPVIVVDVDGYCKVI